MLGDFHARSRFARSTIPEEKWGSTRSLVRTPHIHQSKIGLDRDVYDQGLGHNLDLNFCDITLLRILCIFATYKTTRLGQVNLWDHHTEDTLLESISNDDGDVNDNGKKAIGLFSKTTTSHVHHAFVYISLPSLHDYNVKMPNFTFSGGREQKATTFFFSS